MKKSIIIAVLSILCLSCSIVNAKAIDKCSVTAEAGVITITGKTQAVTVQNFIFNSDESKLLCALSTDVVDGEFKCNVEIENGTYIVKTADYNGGEFKKSSIAVRDEATIGKEIIKGEGKEAPKTGEK